MSAISRKTTGSFGWLVLLIVILVFALAAFCVLLGQRFSPENYVATPIMPGAIEFVLFGSALVATVGSLLLSIRRREAWRNMAYGALPVGGASLLILATSLLIARIQTFHMLLYCVACGWTGSLWLRGQSVADARTVKILRFGIWSVVAALAAWQFGQQVRHLNELALGYADCGENARLMFNSITNPRELFLRVNPDKPLFYDHINVGIVPFLPLWLLWPDLKLTILLEVVAVFGVAIPLYLIGKRALQDESAALLVVLAWVLYPSTSQFVYSASYGFRWGNMCLLLYFVALALWMYERRGWALACAVWAMSIKEEAAIVIGMFGIYLALFERRKIAGLALAAFAFSYFVLVTSVLIPLVGGQTYAMTRFFFDLGHTKWEILLSPFIKPGIFWGKLLSPGSFYFAAVLLAPLLFLPVRKPSILFVGSLTFVFCCMNPILRNICFHYQAALLPVIFWGLVFAVRQDRDRDHRSTNLVAVTVSCFVVSLFLGALPWSKTTLAVHQAPARFDLMRRLGSQIDPHGSLFATQRVAAHFVTQRYLYLDPPVPDQIDYALLDMRDSWYVVPGAVQWLQRLRGIQREVEANAHLHLIAVEDGLLLYARKGAPLDPQKLVERADLPAGAVRSSLDLGHGVNLVAFTAAPARSSAGDERDRMLVTAFFTVAARTNADLAVQCVAYVGRDPKTMMACSTEFQPLGQSVWPIERWEVNKYYADVFILTLPAGLTSEVSGFNFSARDLSQ